METLIVLAYETRLFSHIRLTVFHIFAYLFDPPLIYKRRDIKMEDLIKSKEFVHGGLIQEEKSCLRVHR